MKRAICAAIRERAVLELRYGGGARTVEPYCHGTSAAGRELLSAWQLAGHSESGAPTGWKLFAVERIAGLRRTGSTFAAERPGYNASGYRWSIHCQVCGEEGP